MKDFEKWFQKYGITEQDLLNSLDAWQISRIKQIAKRAYLIGKKSTPITNEDNLK